MASAQSAKSKMGNTERVEDFLLQAYFPRPPRNFFDHSTDKDIPKI